MSAELVLDLSRQRPETGRRIRENPLYGKFSVDAGTGLHLLSNGMILQMEHGLLLLSG